MTQKQFKIKSIQPISVSELQPSPELLEVQNFLPISPEDRERLKKDIEKSGEIRDPIKIYFDSDGNPLILGGFNRWHIAQELGWEFVPCEVMAVVPKERRELAIMDNLARRHMTREQKQKIVEMFLINDPVQSNRVISKKTGVDDKTVGKVRQKLEATAEIPQLEKRAGADGRVRKAEPEKPVKKPTAESTQLDVSKKGSLPDKKKGEAWWTPEMEANKKKNDKLKLTITAKFQHNIDVYEDYIKQCRRSKKEKEQNEGRIMAYQVAISDLKELLKKILKDI